MAALGFVISTQTAAQITFYEHPGFRGQSVTVDRPVGNLERFNFNHSASSAEVRGEPWEVCDGPGFTGRCTTLQPGRHHSLGALNDGISSARPVSARDPSGGYPPQHSGGYPPQYPGGYPPQQSGGYPPQATGAQITFYERRDFRGRSITADGPVRNFERSDFDDRASSAVIAGGPWEVCDERGFRGRCVVLRPGRYSSFREMGLNNTISSARPAQPPQGPGSAGQLTLYEHSGFRGQSLTLDRARRNFERLGINDSASSAVVAGEPWELCDGRAFTGRCVRLPPGRYQSLGAMGLNDSVSSARPAQR
ncbi:MAG TPA: beta/gamma crystallin-related protein [Burkholderiales bacterium]|nr:beta/gamma crystallin-related protein [Burkholderiales bacterium]